MLFFVLYICVGSNLWVSVFLRFSVLGYFVCSVSENIHFSLVGRAMAPFLLLGVRDWGS